MEWHDKGYITALRKHGESSVIVEAFTKDHGRCAGYVKGGAASKRLRGVLVLGNAVHLRWFARLEEQLGSYQVELDKANAVLLLDDALALDGLNALCALALTLPERQAMGKLYQAFGFLLEQLTENKNWLATFGQFELCLLQELGYGLEEAQKQQLPKFLTQDSPADKKEIVAGLEQTGQFLLDRVYAPRDLPLPFAREKLIQKIKA